MVSKKYLRSTLSAPWRSLSNEKRQKVGVTVDFYTATTQRRNDTTLFYTATTKRRNDNAVIKVQRATRNYLPEPNYTHVRPSLPSAIRTRWSQVG